MKKDIIYIIIILFVFGVLIKERLDKPVTDLPEEYELITPDTPIQGEFKNGTLTIEFKH